MTDKIIPEAVIVAAKRGFIRTTAQAAAATLTTQQIDRALSERRQAEWRQSAAAIIAARTGAADDGVGVEAGADLTGG
jgi:hypothetical protein